MCVATWFVVDVRCWRMSSIFDVESEDWSSNVVLFYDHASGYSVLLMSMANDGGKVAKCDVVATVDVDAVFFCFGGADHQLREISKTSTNSEQTHFL
jgi:hypothetical protein